MADKMKAWKVWRWRLRARIAHFAQITVGGRGA